MRKTGRRVVQIQQLNEGGEMPVATVGDQRWDQAGRNAAGDRVFVRNRTGTTYDDRTNDELSAELERRGLAKSGTKEELVARLHESDASV